MIGHIQLPYNLFIHNFLDAVDKVNIFHKNNLEYHVKTSHRLNFWLQVENGNKDEKQEAENRMKTLKSTFDELNNHLEENHDSIKERIKGTGKNIKEINLITVFDRYNNNYKGICRMTHKDFDDIRWYLDRKLEWHKSGQKIIQNDIDKLQWLEENNIEKIEDIDIDTDWRRVTTVFDTAISLRQSFKGKAKKAEIKEEDLFYPSRCALFPWLSFDQFKVIQDYHKNQLNWNIRKNRFTTVNEFVSFYKEVQNVSMTIGREIPKTYEEAVEITYFEDIEFDTERSAQMRVEPNDSILPIQTTTSNLTVDNDQPSNVIDNTKPHNHTTNLCLSPEELNQLGKSYKKGTQYLKKNKSKSFEFYSKCAELGNKDALYEVACSYQAFDRLPQQQQQQQQDMQQKFQQLHQEQRQRATQSSQKDNTKQTPPDDPVTIDKMLEEFPEDALFEI